LGTKIGYKNIAGSHVTKAGPPNVVSQFLFFLSFFTLLVKIYVTVLLFQIDCSKEIVQILSVFKTILQKCVSPFLCSDGPFQKRRVALHFCIKRSSKRKNTVLCFRRIAQKIYVHRASALKGFSKRNMFSIACFRFNMMFSNEQRLVAFVSVCE